MTTRNSFADAFHKECERRGINPRNVLIVSPAGNAIVEGTVRVQCTNGMVKPDKK